MTPIPADRLPPQNEAAERGLLGALLRDPQCVDDLLGQVAAEDFYHDKHQRLFRAVVDLTTAGKAVDLVLLHETLKRRGDLEDAGGTAYLADLWDAAPTAANAAYYARIVRDKALLRNLIHTGTELVRDAYDGVSPGADLLAAFEGRLFDMAAVRDRAEAVHVRDVVREVLDRFNGTPVLGIPTGFDRLDEMTGGWREGLHVVGARPSVGKSAYMLACALAAVQAGVPTLIFSLEMSRHELVERHLSMLSGVNLRRIRGGRLAEGEIASLLPAADGLVQAPLYINDAMGQTPAVIMSVARRMVRRRRVGLVFVDYLQLIEPEDRRVSRVEQLEVISRRLKQLARQTGVPVVALAQVNRAATERESERPKLSDLKGSGAIEQDADSVLLLWVAEKAAASDVWRIGVAAEKQRSGPTGEVLLDYRRSCTRFEDPVPPA